MIHLVVPTPNYLLPRNDRMTLIIPLMEYNSYDAIDELVHPKSVSVWLFLKRLLVFLWLSLNSKIHHCFLLSYSSVECLVLPHSAFEVIFALLTDISRPDIGPARHQSRSPGCSLQKPELEKDVCCILPSGKKRKDMPRGRRKSLGVFGQM